MTSFQEDDCVFSLGFRSLMHCDFVILSDATSLQRRSILIVREDVVMVVLG